MTLQRTAVDKALIHSNGMMVRTSGGTKIVAYGEIDLKILVNGKIDRQPFSLWTRDVGCEKLFRVAISHQAFLV